MTTWTNGYQGVECISERLLSKIISKILTVVSALNRRAIGAVKTALVDLPFVENAAEGSMANCLSTEFNTGMGLIMGVTGSAIWALSST
jgi:hypothetical protein